MIELLVALVLLSLTLLLLVSGLRFGIDVWDREEQSVGSEVPVTQNLVRRLLSEARPIIIEGNATQQRHVFFSGAQNSVRFVAPMPKNVSVGGLYEIAIYLADMDQDLKRVEISWRLFRRAGTAPKEERATLLRNVADMEFAYFGDTEKKNAPRWLEVWHGSQFLPDLIRLSIQFGRGKQVWPDLLVAPMIRTTNPLVQDPETGARGY